MELAPTATHFQAAGRLKVKVPTVNAAGSAARAAGAVARVNSRQAARRRVAAFMLETI